MIKIWHLSVTNYNLVKRTGPYGNVATLDNADPMVILQAVLREKTDQENKKEPPLHFANVHQLLGSCLF